MPSVAGQIRIDVLSDGARFAAGMREAARDGFGSFKAEAEKFDRWHAKSLDDRLKAERDGWVKAMRGADGPLQHADGFLGGYTPDQSLRNQTRWQSMLPTGYSSTSRLTGAQAARAAMVGQEGMPMVGQLARAGQQLGGMLGGNAGSMMVGAMFNPATMGITATIGALAALTHEFLKSAEAARQTVLEADKIGMSVEGFDTLKRAAELTGTGVESATAAVQKMNKAIGEAAAGDAKKTKAFADIGLDPHQLIGQSPEEAFENIAKSVAKIGNQFQRARVEAEIFGRGGMEIDALMRKVATDGDKIRSRELTENQTQGLAVAGAGWEQFKHDFATSLKGDFAEAALGIERMFGVATRLTPEIDRAAAAQERIAEAARQYRDNLTAALEPLQKIKDRLHEEIMGADVVQRAAFVKGLDEKGLKGRDRDFAIRDWDETQAKVEAEKEFKKRQSEAEGMRKSIATPEEKLATENKRADDVFGGKRMGAEDLAEWKKIHGEQLADQEYLDRLKRKNLEDYYREAEGLDAKQIRNSLKGEYEQHRERQHNLLQHGEAAGLSPTEVNRGWTKNEQDERKRLGVKNPLGDYMRELDEHRKALQGGTIDQGEFDKWQKGARKTAVGEMASDLPPEAKPIAAMAAGSREAHSLIAQSQMADPKLQLAQETNKIMNKLEKGQVTLVEAVRELTKALKE